MAASVKRTLILVTRSVLLAILLQPLTAQAAPGRLRIALVAPPSLLGSTVARTAVEDAASLLARMFPSGSVAINGRGAGIRIILPELPASNAACSAVAAKQPYRCLPVPETSFRWRSTRNGATTDIRLDCSSAEAVSSAIYGLLQERLGIRFHHPRETIVPLLQKWPLPDRFTFSGTPRFGKRGFHLHTLHPMELAEQLHNPAWPRAFEDVREYIDWLARNGQNTFQFFLLRGVDRSTWPAHARRIVEYAHQRGIRCGVEISLAMLQQQAFQAVTLLRPFPSYRAQVDDSLAWLFQAPWDFVSLEATMGEHLPFLGNYLPEVQSHLEEQVRQRYGAGLFYATHVICSEAGNRVRRPNLSSSGILIHTVMCYSASEAKAPVYGNRNQRFMLEAARAEQGRRETWYWPESSYWIGFDTSVPLLLLPYLDSRWHDMETMAGLGLDGHMTFSSGWEWGYWLVDWSIARWSWQYADNGRPTQISPLSRLAELMPDPVLSRLWKEALELQNRYLKERELLRYMAAMTPFSELPPPFDRPFQPDPVFSYAWLLHDAGRQEADAVLAGPVHELEEYADAMAAVVRRLAARVESVRKKGGDAAPGTALQDELRRGLEVTALRARHRALTLRALLAKRHGNGTQAHLRLDPERLLAAAGSVRLKAQSLVRQQEAHYRYPPLAIARRRPSMTAYPFGYLYPASQLYFWEREEEQVRRERFDPLFMNLWDTRRTLGLESLLFK